jgi:hypothetical protein
VAEENPKNKNTNLYRLTDKEIEVFREDYREKDREIQRNIGIYLSGLVLITGWLIGPQTKPLLKMALDNYGYNLFGFLIVVALNVIFTCFLIYKSLIIHEIMQFVVVHSPRENALNYWEAWRRSKQSATNNGGIRKIYNGLVLTMLPLFVSIGIMIPLGYLIHFENPQNLAALLKQFEPPPAAATTNTQPNIPPTTIVESNKLPAESNQITTSTANPQSSSTTQNTTASAEQLEFVFFLVIWFYWFVAALHLFPLWFFFQNIGPINKKWNFINSKKVSPAIYDDLKKISIEEEFSEKDENPENSLKTKTEAKTKVATKETKKPKQKD